MSHNEGKTRIELTPQEIEKLLLLVRKEILRQPLREVMISPLPELFRKLNRGYQRIKPSPEAVGSQQ